MIKIEITVDKTKKEMECKIERTESEDVELTMALAQVELVKMSILKELNRKMEVIPDDL